MKQLAGVVRATDPETLEMVTFDPADWDGEDLPDWVYEQVTNPAAWVGEDDPEDPDAIDQSALSDDQKQLIHAAAVAASPENTRDELINIATGLGLEPGEDFPKSAGKDIVLAAIKHH